MSNIITTTGRSINTVTAEIIAISNQAAQMAYMSMIEIGKRLVEAKALVDHGEWGSWLKNEVKFSQRTANNFMQIYERSLSGSNSQTFANLGYSQIVKLLSLTDGELDEFAESHDIQNMSVRQLDKAIKERDEARRLHSEAQAEAEAAQARARDAEQKLLDIQQQAAAAKSSEDAWQQEIDKLNAALNKATVEAEKAKKQVKELKAKPQIPEAMKDELIAGARSEAEQEIRAELQGEIDAAQAEARKAAEERDAVLSQTEAARKSAQMSNPDLMAINLLGKQILEDFNRLEGYRMRAVSKDPELEAKIQAYVKKLVEKIVEKVEGR